MAAKHRYRSQTFRGRSSLHAVSFLFVCCVVASQTFVSGSSHQFQRARGVFRGRIPMRCEDQGTVEIVKVNKDSTILIASVVPSAVGYLATFNPWLGVALFVGGSWIARQDNDVGLGMRAVSEAGLTAINFGGDLFEKFAAKENLSIAFNKAIDKAGNKEAARKFADAIGAINADITQVTTQVDIQKSIGTPLGQATELTSDVIQKGVGLVEGLTGAGKKEESGEGATNADSTQVTTQEDTHKSIGPPPGQATELTSDVAQEGAGPAEGPTGAEKKEESGEG